MNIMLGIAAIVLLLLINFRLEPWQKRRKIESVFTGREPQTPEQFYDRYFKEQGIPFYIVVGVRSILEDKLSADLSRLADTDDFSKNLSFFWDFDSMAAVEIVCALEEKFGIKIADSEAEKTLTIYDIVKLVASKVMARRAVSEPE
jgi:acyl carrier protein